MGQSKMENPEKLAT